MPNSIETRDLVIAAGVEIEHLKDAVESQGVKIDEMHAIMLQAKGAAKVAGWARTILPAVVGFLAAQLGLHFPMR